MILGTEGASGNLRRFENVLSSVSCIKDEWQFNRLGRQYCRSLLFDCGWKWIRRIASSWRAKLSGESESSDADVLRVSVTRGSGHICQGKLNCISPPFGGRRRMWYIRRWWKVGRAECSSGWNEWCHVSQGGPSTCPREREPRGTFYGGSHIKVKKMLWW